MKQVIVKPYDAQERPRQRVVSGYRDDTVYVLQHSGGAVFKGILVWNQAHKKHCLSGVDHLNRPCHLMFDDIEEHDWQITRRIPRQEIH